MPSSPKTVLIVDDIMYYRSMRRVIYQACRGIAHFVVVYVEVNVELAIQRNSQRPETCRVSNEVPHYTLYLRVNDYRR